MTKKKTKKKTASKKKISKKKKSVSKKAETKVDGAKVVKELVDTLHKMVDLPEAIPVPKAEEQYVEVEGLENKVCRLGRDIYKIEIGEKIKILRAHLPILEGAGRVKRLKI